MPDESADQLLNDTLGPEPGDEPTEAAETEVNGLRELMEWVSAEVFGAA
jgi:hypothetical protein